MDEEPAACVDEEAGVGCRVVAFAGADVADLHLAGREQVHARLGPVADRDVTTDRPHGQHLVIGEVFEDCAIRRSDSELLLGELGGHAEEAHLEGALHHRFLQMRAARLSKLGEHIDFINY